MTFVRVIRCDGTGCTRTLDTDTLPAGWLLVTSPGERERHFCSKAHAARWLSEAEVVALTTETAPASPPPAAAAVAAASHPATWDESDGEAEEVEELEDTDDTDGDDGGEGDEEKVATPPTPPTVKLHPEGADGRVLAYIARYWEEHGEMPVGADVADAADIARPYAYAVLKRLRASGLITRDGITPDGLRLVAAFARTTESDEEQRRNTEAGREEQNGYSTEPGEMIALA